MSGYVVKTFEPGLWTVGHYQPDGKFDPEADYTDQVAAGQRCHFLNGGSDAAELATLRALRGVAADFAATWAELLMVLPDSYSCHMTCGEANAAADLFRALGRDDEAGGIIAAHIEHDDEDEREAHEGEPAGLEPHS